MNDALYGKNGQLAFDANRIITPDGRELTGKIQLSGFGANAVFQGDEVTATGKLYPGYGAYQGRMSFAEIAVTARHPTAVSVVRQRFTAGMQTALPEPLAPFAMGLLVGQRATLPENAKQDLLMVGLTHIIAVSGYNLTIILHASRRLLGGQSKRLATFLSLALIAVFLLLTGASASIVRAAIVSVLSIAASYYGRAFKPLNLILLAAAITAWANPVYVWSDLSWYLSFLAFFGVMVLSPLIQARWPAGWHQTLIGGVALESICASVMTEPFILYVFGQISLISLPANMLVVTLIPLAMLLGLAAGLAGMLASSIAGWFAWPAAWLLNYMLDVAHVLAGLPHVFIQNRSLPLAGMLGIYATVISVCLVLRHKTKSVNRATITDKKTRIWEGAMT
jgi:competence protein ComEC